jgi:CRISPR-associated endoribonuclease Cas6
MRLIIDFAPETERIPFGYQNALHAAIHAWLGKNSLHAQPHAALSFGSLRGLASDGQALKPVSASLSWWVGAWDGDVIKRVIEGIEAQPVISLGLRVRSWKVAARPEFINGRMKWLADGSILVKRKRPAGGVDYALWDAADAGELLKANLERKLAANGVQAQVRRVEFDTKCRTAKTKLIDVDGIKVRANACPVYVDADWQAQQFVWSAGIGWSTGMGFGGLKKP